GGLRPGRAVEPDPRHHRGPGAIAAHAPRRALLLRGEGAPGEGPSRAPAGAGEARARLGGILVARRGGGHATSLDRARHRGALALAAALPRLGGSGIPR